jgi:hypothetical protein
MESEHLENLHPGWVVGGWAIAIAVTSAAYLALVGSGLLPRGPWEVLGLAVAMAVGYFVGGLFIGLRWAEAPILHGVAVTLISVLVWFAGSVTLPQRFASDAPAVLGLILVQLSGSVWGGWLGRRLALAGRTPL